MEEKGNQKCRRRPAILADSEKATTKRADGYLFKKLSNSWMRSSALEAVKEGHRDENRRSLLDQ